MKFRSTFDVELVQSTGSDEMICNAARVSTGKEHLLPDAQRDIGLLKFLMSHRHGTPFEHGSMTFRVNCPIFIWREWHRHRIGFSYNEESGRYKKLEPVFYIPGEERREHYLKPTDYKPSKPGFEGFLPGDVEGFKEDNEELEESYAYSYYTYEKRLAKGI